MIKIGMRPAKAGFPQGIESSMPAIGFAEGEGRRGVSLAAQDKI